MNERRPMKKSAGYAIAVLFIIGIYFSTAHSADKDWLGGSGSWNNDSMWSPSGTPQPGDKVNLIELGPSDSVVYNTEDIHLDNFQLFTIDAAGTGSMTFNQSDGSVVDYLSLQVGDRGTYNLNGGELWTSFINSDGTFNQTDGQLYFSSGMSVSGKFNMTGGTIVSTSDIIQVSEGGVVNQSV